MRALKSLAVATSLLALAAFGSAANAQDKIRIGSATAATGPASFLGDPIAKTLKMMVEDINKKGGVLGKQIELVFYDTGSDPTKAKQFAERLATEDKVIAHVGGTTTAETMAMIPVFEEAQIPFISQGGAVVIVEPVKKFTFKTPHTDKMACEKIFEDMKKRGLTKIGMISGQDAFGKSMQAQCKAVVGKYGIEILADETYGPTDNDMTAQLTKIKGTPGIQAVINPGFSQGPAIVTRNYKQLGITVPLYQSHGVASKQFIELAGDAANGVRIVAAALLVAEKLPDSDPQKPVVVGYKKQYEETTKSPVSTFGGHGYDALNILIEAIKRANSTDPIKIRDEIEKTKNFMGTGGLVNMSPTDHMGLDLTAFRMLEIKNGDWELLKD